MPIENILYLAFILAAFTQFAVVLAYAEWATRHVNGRGPARFIQEPSHHNDDEPVHKAA